MVNHHRRSLDMEAAHLSENVPWKGKSCQIKWHRRSATSCFDVRRSPPAHRPGQAAMQAVDERRLRATLDGTCTAPVRGRCEECLRELPQLLGRKRSSAQVPTVRWPSLSFRVPVGSWCSERSCDRPTSFGWNRGCSLTLQLSRSGVSRMP